MKEEKELELKKEIEKRENKYDIKRIKRLIILIILLIIIIVTSFKSGERFFEISNSGFNDELNKVESNVAKWYFNAKICY